jgi:hypothetical protein
MVRAARQAGAATRHWLSRVCVWGRSLTGDAALSARAPSPQARLPEMDVQGPTPVQEAAIPHVLRGENVAIQSYTGSGKARRGAPPLHRQSALRRVIRSCLAICIATPHWWTRGRVCGCEHAAELQACCRDTHMSRSSLVGGWRRRWCRRRPSCAEAAALALHHAATAMEHDSLPLAMRTARRCAAPSPWQAPARRVGLARPTPCGAQQRSTSRRRACATCTQTCPARAAQSAFGEEKGAAI